MGAFSVTKDFDLHPFDLPYLWKESDNFSVLHGTLKHDLNRRFEKLLIFIRKTLSRGLHAFYLLQLTSGSRDLFQAKKRMNVM